LLKSLRYLLFDRPINLKPFENGSVLPSNTALALSTEP
jgi:hypothetical protein